MRKKIFSGLLILSLTFVFGFIYIGFYYQDPEMIARTKIGYKLIFLWGPRICIPIIYVYFIYLIVGAGRSQRKTALYTFVIGLVLLVVLFPFAQLIKSSISPAKDKYADRFHPYMQLSPPVVEDRLDYHGDDYNVFCIGGSTTQYQNSQGEDWPSLLEGILKEKLRTDSIAVHNFGMQWYTTLHTLINYQANLKHSKHDVLIVMHNINDLLHNADFSSFSKGTFRLDYGHFYGPMKNVFKRERNLFISLLNAFGKYWYQEPTLIVDQKEFPGLISFERNLNSIIDLANYNGIKVVLMTQPNILHPGIDDEIKSRCQMINTEAVGSGKKWSYETGIRGMKLYNDLIRQVAQKRNVLLVDLEPLVPKNLDYFSDEVHYTDRAFPVVAQEIARVLLEDTRYWLY